MSNTNNPQDLESKDQQPTRAAGGMSRRTMIRGAAATMPAILSLQSGAALARSSNLISAAASPSKDRYDRTLCLDIKSVYPARGSGHVYDLGEPAHAHVAAINNRDYRVYPSRKADRISAAQACRSGKTVYYVDRADGWRGDWEYDRDGETDGYRFRRHWQQAKVPQGVLVSATALSSFAGRISVTDI